MSDLFSVAGRHVLITGGGRGIGRMLAAAFLAAGATVTISGRDEETLAAVAAELGAGGELHTLCADLRDAAGAIALGGAYLATGRRLDILINNAGRTWGAPLASFPPQAWTDVLGVNVQAPFVLLQQLLALLERDATAENPARVINIGSVYGQITSVMQSYSYAASKAALHQLTRVLARELAPRHVLVNAIAPGLFRTRMTEFVFSADGVGQDAIKRIPLARGGQADDIAGVAIFLASRAGAYVTGAVVPLDGGLSLTG